MASIPPHMTPYDSKAANRIFTFVKSASTSATRSSLSSNVDSACTASASSRNAYAPLTRPHEQKGIHLGGSCVIAMLALRWRTSSRTTVCAASAQRLSDMPGGKTCRPSSDPSGMCVERTVWSFSSTPQALCGR